MENNKSIFRLSGICDNGENELIELQIGRDNCTARYVRTLMFETREPEVTRGRWQKIRYSKRGYAYITSCHKRLYLHNFIIVNSL